MCGIEDCPVPTQHSIHQLFHYKHSNNLKIYLFILTPTDRKLLLLCDLTCFDENKMNDRDGAKQRAHAASNSHRRVEKLSSLLHWDKEWTSYGISHRARQKKN